MTNNHVLPAREAALPAAFQFNYQLDQALQPAPVQAARAKPEGLFYTNPDLDVTVVEAAAAPRYQCEPRERCTEKEDQASAHDAPPYAPQSAWNGRVVTMRRPVIDTPRCPTSLAPFGGRSRGDRWTSCG